MAAPIGSGQGASQALGDAFRFCACLVQSRSRLQPGDNSYSRGPRNSQRAIVRVRFEHKRCVNLDVLVVGGQRLRHNSHNRDRTPIQNDLLPHDGWISMKASPPRSEEHTSELQSPCNLVCRLLLEKKNKTCRAHALITFWITRQPHPKSTSPAYTP